MISLPVVWLVDLDIDLVDCFFVHASNIDLYRIRDVCMSIIDHHVQYERWIASGISKVV